MKLKVANRCYNVSREEYGKFLKMASDLVPFGIYAIEKDDYAELRNDNCKSITQLKSRKRAYRQAGFRVYSNGGDAGGSERGL